MKVSQSSLRVDQLPCRVSVKIESSVETVYIFTACRLRFSVSLRVICLIFVLLMQIYTFLPSDTIKLSKTYIIPNAAQLPEAARWARVYLL